MSRSALLALFVVSMCAGCAPSGSNTDSVVEVESEVVVGVEGASLSEVDTQPDAEPVEVDPRVVALAEAVSRRDAAPDDVDAWIWVGRREGYLGRYDDAIETYTEALERFPQDSRLLRHRGHRHISNREFNRAMADLVLAWAKVDKKRDEVEPDGMPNAAGVPRSTLHTNILYHLGVALYADGRFYEATNIFAECFNRSPNDDMKVASGWWLTLSAMRAEQVDRARAVLATITPEMDLLENEVYHQLLLEARNVVGDFPEDPAAHLDPGVGNATLAGGRAQWLLANGRTDEGLAACRALVESGTAPAAFGFIVAEADLKRAGVDLSAPASTPSDDAEQDSE